MKDYLKHYNMRITALAPIHVGDGREIGKKEYIQMGMRNPVIVPDMNKMFQTLHALGKDTAYAEFALNEREYDLGQWLREQRIPEKYIDEWKRYSMDPGDAFVRKNNTGKSETPKGIKCFIKDSYEKPYVPGSTLKGMMRNALLCWRIHENPEKYKEEMRRLSIAAGNRGREKNFLAKETKALETAVFHTLGNYEKMGNAVNSVMSGFVVSDSKAIDENRLILARKIDVNIFGKERGMPILREALMPGTQIDFEVTIDCNNCNVTIEELMSALRYFNKVSYKYFYSRFARGSKAEDIVWLGGGTGFLSKTMLYPVFGDGAVELTDKVFQTTVRNYGKHKRGKDIANRIAPHVCKCTRYQGKLYDMGMGKIEVL